nr:hypothetical protein BaRGS_006549 [Batillaria attramentaria]
MAGLAQLTFLDMSNNQLQLDHKRLPAWRLQSRSPLFLNSDWLTMTKDREGEYPENVFNSLSSLQFLSIDTFSEN